METLRTMHLTDGFVLVWLGVGLCVGWWARDGLNRLIDDTTEWGIALLAAVGVMAVIVGGVAVYNGWRPSW